MRQIHGRGPVSGTPVDEAVPGDGANGDREMNFATRSLLAERAARLAGALARLHTGEYGSCQECGEAITSARLRLMPEATTCVRCQDRLDRLSRRLETVEVGFGGEG
jgi:DnaK suppressor protein